MEGFFEALYNCVEPIPADKDSPVPHVNRAMMLVDQAGHEAWQAQSRADSDGLAEAMAEVREHLSEAKDALRKADEILSKTR